MPPPQAADDCGLPVVPLFVVGVLARGWSGQCHFTRCAHTLGTLVAGVAYDRAPSSREHAAASVRSALLSLLGKGGDAALEAALEAVDTAFAAEAARMRAVSAAPLVDTSSPHSTLTLAFGAAAVAAAATTAALSDIATIPTLFVLAVGAWVMLAHCGRSGGSDCTRDQADGAALRAGRLLPRAPPRPHRRVGGARACALSRAGGRSATPVYSSTCVMTATLPSSSYSSTSLGQHDMVAVLNGSSNSAVTRERERHRARAQRGRHRHVESALSVGIVPT